MSTMSTPFAEVHTEGWQGIGRIATHPLRLLASTRLWKSLIFLALSLPVGVITFTVLGTLLTFGLGTVAIGIGLVALALAPQLNDLFAWAERWRIVFFLGGPPATPRSHQLDAFVRRPFSRRSIGAFLRGSWDLVRTWRTWRSLLYLLLLYPIAGLETYVLHIQGLLFVTQLVVPVLNWALPGKHRTAASYQALLGIRVESAPVALLCIVIAIVWVFALAYLILGLGLAHRALGQWLLWPSAAEQRARLEARVQTLGESRARLVEAALQERQRIERDLHDGAQQRLVALAMDLGMAREKIATQPEVAQELVTRAHEEAKRALAELRDLVRGIHPAVLSDRGLDPALSALAARSPVPVTITIDLTERLPEAVESTAYFVVAEALTNIAKHSGASEAQVEVRREGDILLLEIRDDGMGGADLAAGSGLGGMADRVAALDGRFTLTSPLGGPTIVHAELPYEAQIS